MDDDVCHVPRRHIDTAHKRHLGDTPATPDLSACRRPPCGGLDGWRRLIGGEKTLIGKPHVAGATVSAEVLGETKGEKLISGKYRPRKRSTRRRTGHRQHYISVRITKINVA